MPCDIRVNTDIMIASASLFCVPSLRYGLDGPRNCSGYSEYGHDDQAFLRSHRTKGTAVYHVRVAKQPYHSRTLNQDTRRTLSGTLSLCASENKAEGLFQHPAKVP